MIDLGSIINQMMNDGINPSLPLIPDEKIHRFKIDEKDSKNSGWYTGFRNTNNVGVDWFIFLYGSHRSGESFKAQSNVKLDKQDKQRAEEQIRKAKRKNLLEKQELQSAAAIKANDKWNLLTDNFGRNEYLERKGFNELYGSRIDGFNIVIPMRDCDGNIKNLETVYGQGAEKKGLYGGERVGLYHQIGTVKDVIYLAEGFSTSVSIHIAMEESVLCCFNSGNLPHVAKLISVKYPNKRIVICGDNDQFSEKNTGREKAEEAAQVCGGKFVVPSFRDLEKRPTDFYDLFKQDGPEGVQKQIESISPNELVETFDRQYVIHHPYPDEDIKSFKRHGTLDNVTELLRRIKIIVRYNVIKKKEEILIPNLVFSMDNEANASLAHVIDWCERVRIPIGNLKTYLTAICDSNLYNPVATWIESEPWDGHSRLRELFDTVKSTDDPLKEILMKRWLISAIAAAYEHDGVSAHGILVFQGAQYGGKTAWFKRLVPPHLKVIKDGLFLRPDDKDSVYQAICNWIVELGEIDATFKKAEISQLKAFATKSEDVIRRPFSALESRYPRRTVFYGSVNDKDFLRDPTGNRRFWTIECLSIDYAHNINMQQLWAEVLSLYHAGEKWVLTLEEKEQLDAHNLNFEEADHVAEKILLTFDWTSPLGQWKTSGEVCAEIGIDLPSSRDFKIACRTLRKQSWEKERMRNGYRQFFVPRKNSII